MDSQASWHPRAVHFVVEELAEDGHTIVRRVAFDATSRFELSPRAEPEQRFALPLPLVIVPDVASGSATCWYDGHRRELHPVQPLLFTLPEVRLRLSVSSGTTRVAGGVGRCPKCNASLRHESAGGAYRSFARDLQHCPACGADVVKLEDADQTLGTFTDATQNDWYWVAAPHLCPSCGELMRRSRLRTARGDAEVERCLPCGLVVLDPADRTRLLDGAVG
jgi:Zn-finger nucleic acid-binding protein